MVMVDGVEVLVCQLSSIVSNSVWVCCQAPCPFHSRQLLPCPIHPPQAYSRALRCCKPGTDDALQPKVFVNLGITQEAEGQLMSACDHYK